MVVAHLDLAAEKQAAGARAWRPDFVLYSLWAMFWLLMMAVGIQDYVRNGGTRLWQPILWEGTSLAVATFWVVLQRRADRRYAVYLDRPLLWIAHHAKWVPLAALTFVPVVYAIRHSVYALLGQTYTHEPWSEVFLYESIKLTLFFGLWLGLIFGFDAFAQAQEQRQRLLALQKSLAEAQLAHLKAQLRPHFFFNALNTISALMQVDVPRADRLLARLADLLRATLQWSDKEITSLREEIRMLELYAREAWDWFSTRRQLSLGLTLTVLGTAMLLLQTGVIERNTPADAVVANVFTWTALMTFIGYGRRYLSFSNPLLRWARDASYPVYILHQTVIVAIGYWVIQQPWSAWTKYAVVLFGTMAICLALYEGIRHFGLTRLLFGMKAAGRVRKSAGPPPNPVAARGAALADDTA